MELAGKKNGINEAGRVPLRSRGFAHEFGRSFDLIAHIREERVTPSGARQWFQLNPGGRLQLGDILINVELSEDTRQNIDLWTS